MFFNDIFEMIKYYNKTLNADDKISVSNEIRTETMNFHIYKLNGIFKFDSNNKVRETLSLCTSNDTYTQVIIADYIIISNDVILTPSYRCKGLILFANKIINNGTISMTSRGCSATGQDIYLYKEEYVPAVGGSGGAGQYLNGSGVAAHGINGANGTKRGTGGGGSGGLRSWGHAATTGRGGNGTSYSGGSGSGGSNSDGGGGWNVTSANGSDTGGAGSNGITGASNGSGYSIITTGGQGNPNGGYSNYRVGPQSFTCAVYGTGGLLVIYASTLENNNDIQANGGDTIIGVNSSASNRTSGGASGGGSVNIFAINIINKGTISANGGIQTAGYTYTGGKGGNGSVTITKLDVFDFVTKTLNRFNSDIYKDPYPESAFDFKLLFNEDDIIITED